MSAPNDPLAPDTALAGPPADPPDAQRVAQELLAALVAHGVRDVVLAPGSRSAPLAYAAHAAEAAGWLRLHVRVDERVAGFVALGLGLAGRPAAVVTTSGTAVANLHPAVLEAAHGRVPLLVLSADRPHENRGTGANQTTAQVGILAGAPVYAAEVPAGAPGGAKLAQVVARAVAAATGVRGGPAGPAHLNVAFREPLVPTTPWTPGAAPAPAALVTPHGRPEPLRLPAGARTVVVAGDAWGPLGGPGSGAEAARLARAGGWPLLAEPSSGARHDDAAVPAYRLLLDLPGLGAEIRRVVVLGHPTLSRPVSQLLAREGVEVVVIDPAGDWTDVSGTAARVAGAADVAGTPAPDDLACCDAWARAGRAAAAALRDAVRAPEHDADAADAAPADPLVAAAAVWAAPGAGTLVVGSSSTVRDLDLVAGAGPAGAGAAAVVANRGLAGIDGTLATATGLALGTGAPVRAVLGDLSFLHDAGALARGDLEPEVDLQVVVLDDHGGSIFAGLEHGAAEHAATFERVFGTPQDVDLVALAAAFGADARRVAAADLPGALAAPIAGRSVLVVPTDRAARRAGRAAAADAARRAARAAL